MRLQLTSDSRILVDLRATGLLRAVGHDPTMTARPEPTWFEVTVAVAIDLHIEVHFLADLVEPP